MMFCLNKILQREQTCRVHLVVGGNVVFHQDWDSMKRTVLSVSEYIKDARLFVIQLTLEWYQTLSHHRELSRWRVHRDWFRRPRGPSRLLARCVRDMPGEQLSE